MNLPELPSGMIEVKHVDGAIGYAVGYDYLRAYAWSCLALKHEKGLIGSRSVFSEWKEVGAVSKDGYIAIMIRVLGKTRRVFLHRLMLTHFVGLQPDGMESLHGVAGRGCNLPSNLRWGTRIENMADKLRDGTHARGEKFYANKITEKQAHSIFMMRSNGMTHKAIASVLGVCQPHITKILNGQRWPHLRQGKV